MANIPGQYKAPYFDSNVFIGWVRNPPEICDGVNRQEIGKALLLLTEQGIFEVFTSTFTLAEVYKKRSGTILKENGTLKNHLSRYLENRWIALIDIDRSIGEKANDLCVKHTDVPLYPHDAIHLACALRAQCDVLLTWDGPLLKVVMPEIRIEKPRIIGAPLPLFDNTE